MMKVCISAPYALAGAKGGHLWVFLNWTYGLRANECDVMWLEIAGPDTPADTLEEQVRELRQKLASHGLGDRLVVVPFDKSLPVSGMSLPLDAATDAELLLNFRYDLPGEIVSRFRRSALIDIDPGVLQILMAGGHVRVAAHDCYFSTGEATGTPGCLYVDAGVRWRHVPPCVSLEQWPAMPSTPSAPFTTVSHWISDKWIMKDFDDSIYRDDKRAGFVPFFDLPRKISEHLELALTLDGNTREKSELTARGWLVNDALQVSGTPDNYRRFIQRSKGEFSCCKPHCVRLQNAWVSDRSLCYLASGKPVIIQHTGPSRLLPDEGGVFRFRTLDEAAQYVEATSRDYDRQCALARAVAEEHFDATKVARRLLEIALS